MGIQTKKIFKVSASLAAVLFAMSCTKKQNKDSSSELLFMDVKKIEDLNEKLSSPDSLCEYLKSENYFPSSQIKSGTEIAFSTSYNVDAQDSSGAEKGQAFGYVTDDGMVHLQDFVTQQVLICPGAFSGLYAGKCAWRMSGEGGYADLAYKVVCNKAHSFGSRGKLHPGYQSQKVAKVSFNSSTAGKKFHHEDAIEVQLAGEKSNALIYFSKGFGLSATEFRESISPSGTVKVYLGGNR